MNWVFTGRNYLYVLSGIGIFVYFNSLFGQFVWDDLIYFVNNPQIHSFNLLNLFGENIFNKATYYRPIPATYFSLLLNTFGGQTFFYHAIQVVLHIVNSVLVFNLFSLFINKKSSLLLSIIFLVHPMNVESVSYIAASVSPLFTLFGLLALFIFCKSKLDSKITCIIVSFLLLLSLLTKETGLLFIVLLLIYSFLFSKKSLILASISGIIAIIFYSLLRFSYAKVFFDKSQLLPIPIMLLSLEERLLHIPLVFVYYIKTFFVPDKLSIDQHWIISQITISNFYIPLIFAVAILIAFIVFGYYLYKRYIDLFKPFIFFSSWFLMGIGLHMQIVPLDMTVADRWFYFPMIGLLGIFAIILEIIKSRKILKLLYIFLIFVIIIFSIRTMARNIDWQSPIYLYSHDLKLDPNNFDLQNNLGNELYKSGDYENAKKHFLLSTELDNKQSISFANLGVVYAKEENYGKAFENFKIAIRNNDFYYPAYEKMALVYLKIDDYEKAKRFIKESIRKFPQQDLLYVFLAEAEFKSGNTQEAKKAAGKAYEINPSEYNSFIYESLLNNRPIE